MQESPVELRIIDLEIRLTHQEAALHELNECIVVQQKTIDQLTRQVRNLQQQLQTGAGVAPPGEETPPPHY
jgi:SlyX protein